ncbi:MAG: hypothetical protein BroJett040_03650 [Oligoflexia bacterium]|nr:MAG: hypothetical protein BroJett040_03650 [Oligoflexia bacterium]
MMKRRFTSAMIVFSIVSSSTSWSQIRRAPAQHTLPVVGAATDDTISIDPIIISDPVTNPDFGTQPGPGVKPMPGVGNGSNGKTGGKADDGVIMRGIEVSMVPGVTCPLVDGRPRLDLVKAAQNLRNSMSLLNQCKNTAEVETMQKTLDSIMTSGTNLHGLAQDPAAVQADKTKMTSMQNDVSNMITGIDQVARFLQTSPVVNSECGRDMMKSSDILLGLNDLIQAATPFAMQAIQLNPAFAPAIPFVIGINGVGAVAKLARNLHDKNTLNMEDSKTRMAVLQSICEYTRVHQRASSFKKAKTGEMKEATENMNRFSAVRASLRANMSSKVMQLETDFAPIKTNLKQAKTSADAIETEIKDIQTQVSDNADKTLSCFVARELVAGADNSNQLPGRVISNLRGVLANQDKVKVSQATMLSMGAMLKAEASLRNQILSALDQTSEKQIESCAQQGQSYIEALRRIVVGTKSAIKSLTTVVDETMSKDPDYRSFKIQETSLQTEIDKISALTKSAGVFRYIGQDNGVLDDSEIDIALREVKFALFGARKGLNMSMISNLLKTAGDSPALAWLNKIDEQMRLAQGDFTNEMKNLRQQLFSLHTRSGKMDFSYVDEKGRRIMLPPHKQNEQIFNDLNLMQTLGPISTKMTPEGSDAHKVMCSRLDNIWFNWYSAVNHLAAQEFFCSNIRLFMDSTTERDLRARCVGYQDLSGKSLKKSEVEASRAELSKKSRSDALLIRKKIDELNCSMYDNNQLNK